MKLLFARFTRYRFNTVTIISLFKVEAFWRAYLVHCKKLLHSRGGYFNSLMLQALELLPGRAEQVRPGTIGLHSVGPEPRSDTLYMLYKIYMLYKNVPGTAYEPAISGLTGRRC